MQKPIFKSLFSTTVRTQTKNIIKSSVAGIHVANKLQTSAIPNNSLINAQTMSFSTGRDDFHKANSFESLNSKLGSASNIEEVLSLVSENIEVMKNEQLVLALRILGRTHRNSPQSQIENLPSDQRYTTLVEKACESIDQFTEYEILDFMFWLRKFRQAWIPYNVSEEDLNKLCLKIKDFIKSKSFNFRNLVNLFYDLVNINKNVDDVVIELIEELKVDSKLLTPFNTIQLLQATSKKSISANPKICTLNDLLAENIANVLKEFDHEQKCRVFKYLSMLDFNINPPRYKLPNVIYILNKELKESLDQLNEGSIIQIIEAYEFLPKEFPGNIIDEIKEMVLLTIEHNNVNIKSAFLMDFLTKIMRLKKSRRLTDDQYIRIYDEIINRLPKDDFLSKTKNLESLVSIYDVAGINHPKLLQAINSKLMSSEKLVFDVKIYDILNKNEIDISPAIKKLIDAGYLNNISVAIKIHVYALLTEVKNDQFAQIEEELKKIILEKKDEMHKFMVSLTSIGIYNEKIDELINIAITNLQAEFRTIKSSIFFKDMLLSLKSRTTLLKWFEFITSHKDDFVEQEIHSFYTTFFGLNDYDKYHSSLFEFFTASIPPEKVPIKKLLIYLKDSRRFIASLKRKNLLLSKLSKTLIKIFDAQKENIRLPLVYSIGLRFDNLGVYSPSIVALVRRAFKISRNSEKKTNTRFEALVALYLLEENALEYNDARGIYDTLKEQKKDMYNIYMKLYAYILRNMPEEELNTEDTLNRVNELLGKFSLKLTEDNHPRVILNALATILSLPPKFLEENRDLYLKKLKEALPLGNSNGYMGIVKSLSAKNIKNRQFAFYNPFVRELINNYNTFSKRLPLNDLIIILTKMSEIYIKNVTIYNHIINDLNKNFDQLKLEDYIQIIQALARINNKQEGIFERITAKFISKPNVYGGYFRPLFDYFYKLGYESNHIKEKISELVEDLKTKNMKSLYYLLQYMPVLQLGLEKEKEIFTKCMPEFLEYYKSISSQEANPKHSIFIPTIFIQYLKYVHKDHPEWAESFSTNSQLDSEKNQSNLFLKNRNLVGEYLKAMKIDYKENENINGFNVDLVLPEKKIIIKIFITKDLNVDKASLTGKSILIKRIYESFTDYKPVFINAIQFYGFNDHMSRINYLISNQIESNETSGIYDFSKIDAGKKEKFESEIESVAEEPEKDSEAAISEQGIDDLEIPDELEKEDK